MDFDGDGFADMISGSYDPGEFYLFRGLGHGKYAARQTIVDKNGKSVLTKPDQKKNYESFGSWIATVDWENDGDLDLVLGSFSGGMLLRLNEGTRIEPKYAVANVPIQAGGKEIKVASGHATPVVADWDGDGKWDLLSGSDSGAVFWYRNTGSKTSPQFQPAQQLVEPKKPSSHGNLIKDESELKPSIRCQIAVVDYNNDGKVDLLVGDYNEYISLRKNLTDEESQKVEEVLEKNRLLRSQNYSDLKRRKKELQAKYEKLYPGEDLTYGKSKAAHKFFREKIELQSQSQSELKEQRDALLGTIKKFYQQPQNPSFDGISNRSGFVWLFLRK